MQRWWLSLSTEFKLVPLLLLIYPIHPISHQSYSHFPFYFYPKYFLLSSFFAYKWNYPIIGSRMIVLSEEFFKFKQSVQENKQIIADGQERNFWRCQPCRVLKVNPGKRGDEWHSLFIDCRAETVKQGSNYYNYYCYYSQLLLRKGTAKNCSNESKELILATRSKAQRRHTRAHWTRNAVDHNILEPSVLCWTTACK